MVSVVYRLAALGALSVAVTAAAVEPPPYKPGGVYPSRPVRLIVPHAPGGATDAIARLLAAVLSESLGQPVIVDNREGDNGVAGADLAAKSGNQGYTLLMTDTAYAVNAGRDRPLPYHPVKDLVPITLVAKGTSGWHGLFAPAGMQWNIITHLAEHAAKALARGDVKDGLAALGATGVGSDPEAFQAFVAGEISKWRRSAKSAKTRVR